MKLVKRGNISISPTGEVIFEESPKGKHKVFSGVIEKSNYTTLKEFIEFLNIFILPEGFQASEVFNSIKITYNKEPDMNLGFQLLIKENGLYGYCRYGNIDNYQLLFYGNHSNMNTLSFFKKIFSILSEEYYKIKSVMKVDYLKSILPGVNIKRIVQMFPNYTWQNTDDKYDVTFAKDGHREQTIRVEIKNDKISMIGWVHEDDDAGREWEENIAFKQAEIRKLQAQIDLMQDFENAIININGMDEVPKSEPVKHENRGDYLRELPRHEELQALTTDNLLHYLNQLRKGNWEFRPHYGMAAYSAEEVRAELSHREHRPKGKAGKEARRKAAQQHHGSRKK